LIAANAETGAAKAAFFPQIALTSSAGGATGPSPGLAGLLGSTIWSYGAQLIQPVVFTGALRSGLRLAQLQQQSALINYKQTVQRAFGEVSDALVGYQQSHEVRVQQETVAKNLREAVRLSLVRYRGGITSYFEVLDGQRGLFAAELSLAQARGAEYQSFIRLYKSLGGGWQQ
jgi:multidrug efflux system outer membrane protein